MIAVIIVRDGGLPAGYDEAICEADRRTLLLGSKLSDVLRDVSIHSLRTWCVDIDPSSVPIAELARIVADALGRIDPSPAARHVAATSALHESVVLPASPDGRDLAPHIALALNRPLCAGAMSVTNDEVTVTRNGGLHLLDIETPTAIVATLQIGVRGSEARVEDVDGPHVHTELVLPSPSTSGPTRRSVESIEIQPPDASTMDLAEAPRILGGGAGLVDSEAFRQLHDVAEALDASMGVTRVITDRGWADHNRQIGTTGVVVDPRLYISFGISGAVQHTSGLGSPDHIISINTDAHCPMMQMSDVAIVADANEVLAELEALLVRSERPLAP